MGYLNKEDYKEIKEIVEVFVPTTNISKNLFRALIGFLETKNEITIVNSQVNKTESTIRYNNIVEKELESADKSLEKLNKKLFKNVKRKKANNQAVK
jgi:hypothetical protein